MADHATAATESGVDEGVTRKFPGAEVTIGSAASGAGDNREIPLSEGGDINPATGKYVHRDSHQQHLPDFDTYQNADDLAPDRPSKARDFEGVGGPEDKAQAYAEAHGGENDVRGNIRQGGDTIRPAGSLPSGATDGTGKRTS